MSLARPPLAAAAVAALLPLALGSLLLVGCEPAGEATVEPVDATPVVDVSPAETGPYPKVVVDEPDYHFGSLALGNSGSHTFEIRNEGEAPLRLGKPEVTCKCTIPAMEDGSAEIPPGGSTTVTLEYTPNEKRPEFVQRATIPTNDPEAPKLELFVRGRVDDLLVPVPGSAARFGSVTGSDPAEESFEVMTRMLDEVTVTGTTSTSEYVTATTEPLPRAEVEERGYRAGVKVTVRVDPAMPIGRFKEEVDVTFDQKTPYDVMKVAVTGTRQGPIAFVPIPRPGQLWAPEVLAYDLGTFPAAEGRTGTLQLFVEDFDEPLELSNVTSSVPYVEMRVRPDETFEGGPGKQKLFLDFVVPPGSPAASHRRKQAVRIKAETNHPAARELNFIVEMVSAR